MFQFVPITAAYASLLAVVIVALSYQVTVHRHGTQVDFGDGGDLVMARVVRAHASAVENIPIALLLILVLELNNAHDGLLHVLGSTFLVARIFHGWGLSRHGARSFGRTYGTFATWLVILLAAASNLAIFID